MKNLKKLKSETSEILNEIKKTHYNEFTQVNEYQMKLQEYYDESAKNLDNETLLRMYKHITKEKKGLYDILNSIICGTVGGFIVELIKAFDTFPNNIISLGLIFVVLILIALLIIQFVIMQQKNDPSYKNGYFDIVHSNILEKLIKERDFCLFRGDKK